MIAARSSAYATARRTWTSLHGFAWAFMLKYAAWQLGTARIFACEADANARGSLTEGTTSTCPARIASASLVSSEKNLKEICWIGTAPPHQCGLAESSTPVVGSKLSTFQGPVPITSVPGCPNVALCAC